MSLAFVWAFRTGLVLHRVRPVRPKKHGRLGQSLFRAGLDLLTLWALALWGAGEEGAEVPWGYALWRF